MLDKHRSIPELDRNTIETIVALITKRVIYLYPAVPIDPMPAADSPDHLCPKSNTTFKEDIITYTKTVASLIEDRV